MGTIIAISIRGFASTLDISLTADAPPVHHWPGDVSLYETSDFQFEDQISQVGTIGWQPTINLAGINSISVTWNAPAGEMYVVNPPPANIGNLTLAFELQYGNVGDAASLGNVTSSSLAMNTVYGNPTLNGGAGIDNDIHHSSIAPGLDLRADTTVTPGSSSFAFTSITLNANFDGTNPSGILGANDFGQTPAYFFGILFGIEANSETYNGSGDPGQLLTEEPLQNQSSVPDKSSSMFLGMMGIAALSLCKRCKCLAH